MALGKVPQKRKHWLKLTWAYSLGGAASSAVVGVALGGLGALIISRDDGYLVAALVAAACIARESLFPELWIPQPRRQTSERWAKTYSPTSAALLWGLDIGLTVTTWFTFSGALLVLTLAFLSASAGGGAAIVLAYWIGRALSVWAAPFLAASAVRVPEALDALNASRRHAQLMHVLALITCLVALAALSFG
jgi:cytochrome c biogenesis protein CcdA